MAITRAQQARQMLKKGSKPIVQGGVDNYLGKQPQVVVPRNWQSGPDKPPTELAYITKAEKDLLLKKDIHGSLKDGPNEGPAGIMSLDSFGDIGGGQAGSQVDSDSKADKDAGTFGGGDAGESPTDRKAREQKETARLNELKEEQERNAKEMQEEAKKNRPNFLESFLTSRRKQLYNLAPNNPKNELKYIQDLKFRNPSAYNMLPNNLKSLYEETEEAANEFSSYKDFNKFSFDDFEDLRTFDPGDTGAMDFADYAATYAGAPGLKYSGNVGNLEKYVTGKDEFGRTMYGYREKTGNGGDNNYVPPIIPEDNVGDDVNADDQEIINYRLMADGGMTNDAPVYEGGIMDLESSRQMYGLGKLVKKITRGVKKVVKSPIGKAAIGAALFKFGGGKGIMGKLFGLPGVDEFGGTPGFLSKFGLTSGFGSKMPTALGGIAATTLGSYFMTPEEEDNKELNAGADLPFPIEYYLSGQYKPNPRLAADGGIMRLNYAEGSEEPVAKKTMPLLDMDGQEMDLREEGGFVPLGRMERADDVPARLSKNEFVFTADAVRNAGEGDVDKGAEVMYNMMKNLESGGEVSEESQGLDGAREMFKTSQRLEEVI